MSACATIFSPGPDLVHVQSNPSGAQVLLDGLVVGTTPTSFQVSRKARGALSIQHPNHATVESKLTTTLNGAVLVNVLFPGLLGILIDAIGGNCTRWQSPQLIQLSPPEAPEAQTMPRADAGPKETPPQNTDTPVKDTAVTAVAPQPILAPSAGAPVPKEPLRATLKTRSAVGFFVTADGFSLWDPIAPIPLDGSTKEVTPSTTGGLSVRKAQGKHTCLALETADPTIGSTVFYLADNRVLMDATVVSIDSANGTLKLSTASAPPTIGAPIVDPYGSVVGCYISTYSETVSEATDFTAASCTAIQRALRRCPTITRPLPAPTRTQLGRQELESLLQASMTQNSEAR